MINYFSNSLNKYFFEIESPNVYKGNISEPAYKSATNTKVHLYNISSVLIVTSLVTGILKNLPMLAIVGVGTGLFGCIVIEKSFDQVLPRTGVEGLFTQFADWITPGTLRPTPDLKLGDVVILYSTLK